MMSEPVGDAARAFKEDLVRKFLENADEGNDAANDELIEKLDQERGGDKPREGKWRRKS